MKEIIEALEMADGPDRSIDGMIAHAVNLHVPDDPEGWPLRYTESIDAAMTLVPEGWDFCLCQDERPGFANVHKLGPRCDGPTNDAHASTPALALCIAALKARSLPAI